MSFRTSLQGWVAGVVVAAGAAATVMAQMSPAPFDKTAHAEAVQAWRAKHDTDYRRDWVSIAGLFVLKAGANTAGSAAGNTITLPASLPAKLGTFVLEGTTVRFEPDPSAKILLRNQPVLAPIALRDDETPQSDELVVGDVRMVIHISGTQRALRVRDPSGPLAKGFRGFTWFPIDPGYRVVGHFIKDAEASSVKVANTYGDIDTYKTEGVVEFTLQGKALHLRPFTTRPKRFYFVFKDASSGHETYGAARFFYADLLDDGSVVLDFNEAYNPPCSFNPYTTCPIPLKENRLPIKILAGEKAYVGPEPKLPK